ncbi:hypothetical protein ACFOWE_12840 [Planomonospora corallina]|uniref:Uncharacterized protein n=1 Tax=Planomonospora corallina TaxID=1806052 RepID=A0ABV8IBI5_9ACTN
MKIDGWCRAPPPQRDVTRLTAGLEAATADGVLHDLVVRTRLAAGAEPSRSRSGRSLPFPYAAQALQVKRRRTDRHRNHPADGLQLLGLTT